MMESKHFLNEIKKTGKVSIKRAHDITTRLIEKKSDDYDGELEDNEIRELAYQILDAALLAAQSGDENDYHNYALAFVDLGDLDAACRILEIGLKRSPSDTDLLGDYLKYAPNSSFDNRFELCKTYYDRLKGIDFREWKWRPYVFAVDYLLALCKQEGADKSLIKKEALFIAKKYQTLASNDEKAYLTEATIREAFGETEKKRAILEKAFEQKKLRASRVSMGLAEMAFIDKDYKKSLEYISRAEKDAVDIKRNSMDIGSVFFCKLLSKVALYLEMKIEADAGADNEDRIEQQIKDIYTNYSLAKKLWIRDKKLLKDIKRYIDMIEILSGIPRLSDDE